MGMWGTILRRLAIGGLAAGSFMGAGASGAQAFMAYTGDSQPSVLTATVYGYVDTGNLQTEWAFAYGSSTSYGHWSSASVIPAGKGTVLVAAQLTGLAPGQVYHYALAAVPLSSSGPDNADARVGADQTLTTEPEEAVLLSPALKAHGASVPVGVGCASASSCSGVLTLRASSGARCASASFTSSSWKLAVVTLKLSRACQRLVSRARGHQLAGTLTARLSSGQQGFSSPVTVSRR